MATAVRLSTVALFSVGDFGHRVNDVVASALPASHNVPTSELDEAFAGRPDIVVAALWRADHAVCERADRLAHDTGVAWLPVVQDHAVLRVGPLVLPGAGPCFRCFDRRKQQHDAHGNSSSVVRAAYERDPKLGPAGHLPFHVRVAGGLAVDQLQRPAAGHVVTVRLPDLSLSRDRVVSEHACRRCRETPPRLDVRALLPERFTKRNHG
ncbi:MULTISPECIES: TOMM precursor leader peptide-binding protein [unclassified Streptomyces]|uniref:TOMM precursor leader peptide-binding protein n=1 Tax=unclassified Streptomyces TaxID=2593676 RepID=UPI0036EC2838